ncbi:DNA-3-methyladenine glycosylase I [Paraburkholderia steynii]|uniref:DNA-3-methyladenine glycosylase I n=2 Tax=Paraburkholderia steynii TaxID=1245441 RepID=A0A7Z7BK14_9BURK|nr:DNA-3-methyladenine glycosylase I [Paraburkholderia steynii]
MASEQDDNRRASGTMPLTHSPIWAPTMKKTTSTTKPAAKKAHAAAKKAARPKKPQPLDAIIGADGLARPPWASVDPLLKDYYDTEWGMPVRDERGLFERLSLEAFQSGLSWATILRKRDAFREAFANFDPDVVASFDEKDIERLMNDERIVRNRAKILATIANAAATIRLRDEGGLAALIWSFQPHTTPAPRTIAEIPTTSAESLALSKALRKRGFVFVGPTTMHALMEATGIVDTHLVDSHRRGTSGVWPRE